MKTIASVLLLVVPLSLVFSQTHAEQAVGGDETNNNRLVDSSNTWTVLTEEPFILTKDSYCVATGSADSENPKNGNNRNYRFVLSLDDVNPTVDSPCERTVEHDANTQNIEEVSSTCTFRHGDIGPIPAGLHTISWLARKVDASPNMTVRDNSLTFICQEDLLDNDGEVDGY